MKSAEQLKSLLQTQFFKNSSMKEIEQNVVFFDGEFIVEIKNKIVMIERIKEKKIIPPPVCNSFLKNIHELAEYQSQTVEGLVYKDFKEGYVKSVLGKRPNIFNMKKVSNEQVELLIVEAQIHMEEYYEKLDNWRKTRNELKNLYKENSKFLLSINNDLLLLQNNGFKIKSSMWTKFHSDLLEVINAVYIK